MSINGGRAYVFDHQARRDGAQSHRRHQRHHRRRGLRIVAQRRVRITREQAEAFYAVHKARPFFGELVDFMISGPVVVQALEGENAIAKYRDIMGATDPAKAAAGTIRKVHAKSIGENSVHGSDAPDTAAKEIAQFFAGNDLVG
jgi:nucleoside-diphosphate kinase